MPSAGYFLIIRLRNIVPRNSGIAPTLRDDPSLRISSVRVAAGLFWLGVAVILVFVLYLSYGPIIDCLSLPIIGREVCIDKGNVYVSTIVNHSGPSHIVEFSTGTPGTFEGFQPIAQVWTIIVTWLVAGPGGLYLTRHIRRVKARRRRRAVHRRRPGVRRSRLAAG